MQQSLTSSDAALTRARERDRVGHEIHTALGILATFSLPLSPAINNIAMAILLGCGLIRLWVTLPCYRVLLRDRLLWLWLLWAAWLGVTIVYSLDVEEGLTELKAFRVILLPLLLWPVIDRIPRLIAAFLGGVFVMNVVQVVQVAGWFGLGLEGDGRARAGLHPIQTGAMALAVMLWHLSWLFAQTRERNETDSRQHIMLALVVIGLLAASFGVVASGSRGVWVATVITLPIAWVMLAMQHRTSLRRNLIVVASIAMVGVTIWMMQPTYLQHRIATGWQETTDAVVDGDYDSSTGLRILFWKWGWEFFLDSPFVGQGAGSFRKLSIDRPEHAKLAEQWPDRAERGRFLAAHPHSLYLHMLYATGLGGFIVACLTLWVLLVRCWKSRGVAPNIHGDFLGGYLGGYLGGTIFVFISWLIGTQFDCYHLNGHLFGLFALIVAATLPIGRSYDAS